MSSDRICTLDYDNIVIIVYCTFTIHKFYIQLIIYIIEGGGGEGGGGFIGNGFYLLVCYDCVSLGWEPVGR